jgi:hypothetical protein
MEKTQGDRFTLNSAEGGFRLECDGLRSIGGDSADVGYFTARLVGPSLSAAVEVYDSQVEHWSQFFQGLAEHWRGWEGARVDESLEGHLRLSGSSDGLGHVRLQVLVAGDPGGSRWQAEAVLVVDAGSLDGVARDARLFFG